MGPPGFVLNVSEESWAEGGATTPAVDEHKHCERADSTTLTQIFPEPSR